MKKVEKLTKKILLNLTKVRKDDFKFLLEQLCIKDRSQQLRFFLDYLFKNYKLSIIKDFIIYIIPKLKNGIINFRGERYKVEKFCKELNVFKEKNIYILRTLKKYKVRDSHCPKCNQKLLIGRPQCPNCKIPIKW